MIDPFEPPMQYLQYLAAISMEHFLLNYRFVSKKKEAWDLGEIVPWTLGGEIKETRIWAICSRKRAKKKQITIHQSHETIVLSPFEFAIQLIQSFFFHLFPVHPKLQSSLLSFMLHEDLGKQFEVPIGGNNKQFGATHFSWAAHLAAPLKHNNFFPSWILNPKQSILVISHLLAYWRDLELRFNPVSSPLLLSILNLSWEPTPNAGQRPIRPDATTTDWDWIELGHLLACWYLSMSLCLL